MGACMFKTVMVVGGVAGFLLLGFGSPTVVKAQGTFDCRRAASPSDKAICSTPALAAADQRLNDVFREALAAAENPSALRSEQQEWTQNLRNCSGDTACLAAFYTDRTSTLIDQTRRAVAKPPVTGSLVPAAQEADPPALQAADEPTDGVAIAELQPESVSSVDEGAPLATAPSDGASDVSSPPERQETIGDGYRAMEKRPLFSIAAGGVVVGAILAVLLALFLTKSLADFTTRKYGWPLILNWWNALYLVGAAVGIFVASFGGWMMGLTVFAGCWLIVLIVNIIKTDLLTGTVMSIVQPLVVVVMWTGYGATRSKIEGPRS